MDDLRAAAVQVRQPLRYLDGPAQGVPICVNDLRAAAQAFLASSLQRMTGTYFVTSRKILRWKSNGGSATRPHCDTVPWT